jgi:4'-phosphopantetheinyl transferase
MSLASIGNDPATSNTLMRTVAPDDMATIAVSLNNKDIHLWLLDYQKTQRRKALHDLLGVYLGLPGDDIVLVSGEFGRPELTPPWNRFLQFNWSHSGEKALVAIARDVTPGVDIEHIRPRPKALQLAERFFHPDEVSALSALDKTTRELAFLQLWTGKEAVLKATGRGIAFGLHRLSLGGVPDALSLRWLENDDASQWQLRCVEVAPDYVASIAWRGEARDIAGWRLA